MFFQQGNHRIVPAASDPVARTGRLVQALAQQALHRETGRRTNRAADHSTHQRQAVANVRHDMHLLVVVMRTQTRAPGKADIRRRAVNHQIAGGGIAIGKMEVARNRVKSQPLAEHIAKVQGEPTRQLGQ